MPTRGVTPVLENLRQLPFYLSFDFVQRALIVGVLIALVSSLLGVTLVLKRFSFIGHGLSNVAFGTIAVAMMAGLTNNIWLVLPVTIGASILLLRMGKNTRVNGDAAVALISVGGLGIGYMLMNMFPGSANVAGDVCTTLFGSASILTLTQAQVWLSVILSVVVIVVFCLFYHQIFAVTFDEDFASATGTRAGLYNTLLAVIIAVIIVLAINLVGTLLISALVIFPAVSAMRLFKNFFAVTVCSVFIAVLCAVLGMIASIVLETPVGSSIVATQIIVFCLSWLVGLIARR